MCPGHKVRKAQQARRENKARRVRKAPRVIKAIPAHQAKTARPALKELRELNLQMPTSISSSEAHSPLTKVRFLALALGALVRLILQLQVDLTLQAQLVAESIGRQHKIDQTRLRRIVG